MPRKVGKYLIGHMLGEGTFGKVRFATNSETGEEVAIKVLDKERIQRQNMGDQIKREISIMKMIRHPHVVQLHEVLASRTRIFIVLELITGGELFDRIVERQRFDDDTARYYFRQLAEGVHYCHTRGVCHRDLKPENLLLDANDDLKISDFGLSSLYKEGSGAESHAELLHTTCGTPNYVAPEVLADQGYDGHKADVWSCGVILYVLVAGFLPFDENTTGELFRKIQSVEFSYPSWFSPLLRSLIDKILVRDPKERIRLVDIMTHPWYTKEGELPQGPVISIDSKEEESESTGPTDTEEGDEPDAPDVQADHKASTPREGTLQRTQSVNARVFRFMSSRSLQDLREKIEEGAGNLGLESRVEGDTGDEVGPGATAIKVKATKMTSKGQIGLVVRVSVADEDQDKCVIEIQRGRGDIMEYYQIYADLMSSCLRTLVDMDVAEGKGGIPSVPSRKEIRTILSEDPSGAKTASG
eukprot:CAMPEP_0118868486 /NCGR_PEP_ID=MMETSP1163-20130328/11954_1 /TAXON_ID=124430 /ORGANISM="Phaeomonas parva, Strain CCMP2877" /LENGTH=470 /DNA_ID=CAMNT_0006803169 /DNA_START=125 /DNA_END=1537 /DNA_ORIENTATION=-